jgi:hypothetical protein
MIFYFKLGSDVIPNGKIFSPVEAFDALCSAISTDAIAQYL